MKSGLSTTEIQYAMTSDNTLVAIDIGNTQVKILLNNRQFSFSYKENWLESIFSTLEAQQHCVVGVSSVQPQRLQELKEQARIQSNCTFIFLEDFIATSSLPIDFSAVEGMGMDRMLGLYGALQHSSPPYITIDCGTAITINVVQRTYRCLGGTILPGITTQLRALHHYTGQLPLVEPVYRKASTGYTTHEAIAIGVLRGASGAIKEIVARIVEKEFQGEEKIPVFITGGDAPFLLQEMDTWFMSPIHSPNLVREGILMVTCILLERGIVHVP